MHFHLAIETGEFPIAQQVYNDKEDALAAFVAMSNMLFGNIEEKDTRITLEECYEALEYDPKALFVGWGLMRVVWLKCEGCTPHSFN